MNIAKDVTETFYVWEDYNYKGEGLVNSVIDSAIDYTHKDMKLTDASKAKLDEDDVQDGVGKIYYDKVSYGYNFADDNYQGIDNTF